MKIIIKKNGVWQNPPIPVKGVKPKCDKWLKVPNEADHLDDLTIEEFQDERGNTQERAVFNEAGKTARLAREAQEKADATAAKQTEWDLRQAVKARMETYETQIEGIDNLPELKAVLKNVTKDLFKLAQRVL